MFNLFRSRDKAVRIVLGALLLLVATSMLLYLVPGGPTAGTRNTDDQIAAEVGGEAITAQEVQARIQSALRNQHVPENLLYVYVPRIVDGLIRERAMAWEARRLGLEVSDADLANMIQSIGGGQFSNRTTYERFVGEQGMTIPQFEARVREAELASRLQSMATAGIVITPEEARQAYNEQNEKVRLQYVAFSPEELKGKINPTPSDLEDYFNRNRGFYKTQEKRDLDALIVDQSKMAEGIELSDAQVRNWYGSHLDQFRIPERVHVRHILLKTTGQSPDEVNKIKAKAEALLKQVRSGGDFAQLATKNSDDPGSAQHGGDVGWIVRGQTVPNFESAAFSLKPNEISGLVTTEYGFHIVQVLAHEQARVRPFDEVRGEIATGLKSEMVADRMQSLADQARAELAKAPRDCVKIGARLGIACMSVGGLIRGVAIPGIGTDKDTIAAITALKEGEVSQVLPAGTTRLVIASLRKTIPSGPAEYADVKDTLRGSYISARTGELMRANAKKAADIAKSTGDLEAAAKATGATVKTTDDFTRTGAAEGLGPAAYLREAFSSPVGRILGPIETSGGQVVAKVIAKTPADAAQFVAQQEKIIQELKQQHASEQSQLFQDSVMTRLINEGKLKYHKDVMDRILERQKS
ncbi:MAG: peptidylprolyl isomerase [Bryobacteraceae bacterium]|jgi:peptidyl-prolyl cis-trans isomerase D